MEINGRYVTRKEFFGRIVFDKVSAVTREFDKKGFTEHDKIPIMPLSAPETVHLSITGKCNLHCPNCYSKKEEGDMSAIQLKRLINQLSRAKVFQLAIGGGEPLMRTDLPEIIEHCNNKGIVANLTTNGTLLNRETAKELRGKVGQINISFKDLRETKEKALLLKKYRIKTGINLLATRNGLSDIGNVIDSLKKLPVESITILRPKPAYNMRWYEQNKLRKEDMARLKTILDEKQGRLRVDCSLVSLMGLQPEVLSSKAIYGCTASLRFCTIKNNGDVFPCSFFISEDYKAGNVLDENFLKIWRSSKKLKKFRSAITMPGGKCKTCGIFPYCKGCRAIALHESNSITGEERYCIR